MDLYLVIDLLGIISLVVPCYFIIGLSFGKTTLFNICSLIWYYCIMSLVLPFGFIVIMDQLDIETFVWIYYDISICIFFMWMFES